MTTQAAHRFELIGPIYNFAEKENAAPDEAAQEAGLTFVAMDAGAYAAFRGGASTGEWIVARKVLGNYPQLKDWPRTEWRFRDQAMAREAYAVALRWLETENGISAMASSHLEAKPLWADQIPTAPKKVSAPAPVAAPTAASIAAAQAAFAKVTAGGAGARDPDPELFPGKPVAKLSDYVKLMKGMQKGDMMGALKAAGLDMMGYGAVAGEWGMKMAMDPSLTAKFSAMMAKS